MIFIYELQKSIPDKCEPEYKFCFPLNEAKKQYQFLYLLDLDLLKNIETILFLYQNQLELKIYKETLAYYSAILKSYKEDQRKKIKDAEAFLTWEYINGEQKGDGENKNGEKRNVIEELIRSQKFVEVKNSKEFLSTYCKNTDVIIHTPYIGELTSDILQNISDVKKVRLFSNSKQMKSKDDLGIIEVDAELYVNIDKELKKIASKKKDDLERLQERFAPKSFLEIFSDTLLNDLTIINEGEKKRLQILGGDDFLAFRFIQKLLQQEQSSLSDIPFYHDLRRGIPFLIPTNKYVVLFNFHFINNYSKECKKLAEYTRTLDREAFVVLQAAYKNNFHYFLQYYDINLPNRQIIEKGITSIFIALLRENYPLHRDFHELKSFIETNAFLVLLKEVTNLENLHTVLKKSKNVDFNKLWIDTDLWYFILNESKQLDESNHRKKNPKQIIIFDFNNGIWEISIDGNMFSLTDSLGIKYVATIIRFYQLYKEGIHVSDLRRLVYAIDSEVVSKSNEVIAYEMEYNADDDYKSIDGCLKNSAKKGTATYKLIEELRNKFINYHNKYYSYNHIDIDEDAIEIEVNHPKISKLFFDPYHNSPLPKHHK